MTVRGALLSAAAGAALAAAAWLVVGRDFAGATTVDELKAQVAKRPVAVATKAARPRSWAAAPFDVAPAGPLSVKLDGIAKSPRRQAALVGINGQPSAWIELGETKNDVTVTEVGSGQITLDSRGVSQALVLGQTLDLRASVSATQASAATGFRGPPEPASAPRRP